jgi:hypothetical protein
MGNQEGWLAKLSGRGFLAVEQSAEETLFRFLAIAIFFMGNGADLPLAFVDEKLNQHVA